MKIFLIRHGETVDNIRSRIQGWKGGTLTKKGILQAKYIGKYLKNISCKYLYTSDLQRCMQTTEQIVNSVPNIVVRKTPALRERNWGVIEGKTYTFLVKLLQKHHEPYHIYTPENAELWDHFAQRIIGFVNMIIKDHKKEDAVIVVTSGGVSSVIIGTILGKDLKKSLALRQSQACINILNYDGQKLVVEKKNLKSHLLGMMSNKRTPYL